MYSEVGLLETCLAYLTTLLNVRLHALISYTTYMRIQDQVMFQIWFNLFNTLPLYTCLYRSILRPLRCSVRCMWSASSCSASSGAMVGCWSGRRSRKDSATFSKRSQTAYQMTTQNSQCLTTMSMSLESGMSGSRGIMCDSYNRYFPL